MDDTITLKGIKDGLLVTAKPGEKWSDVQSRLVSLIDSQENFFRGAKVTLSLGSRELKRGELANVQKQLARRDVTLLGVLCENQATLDLAQKFGLQTALAEAQLDAPAEDPLPLRPPPIDPEEHGTPGVLINRTLRNGRTVHSDGHVVVLGDVNAGAMIVAGGDVMVWGRLRGTVHAGAYGNESAVVCALYLAPTQLRIAGYITISPEDKRRRPRPEMALVRNGRIEAEAWQADHR